MRRRQTHRPTVHVFASVGFEQKARISAAGAAEKFGHRRGPKAGHHHGIEGRGHTLRLRCQFSSTFPSQLIAKCCLNRRQTLPILAHETINGALAALLSRLRYDAAPRSVCRRLHNLPTSRAGGARTAPRQSR